MKNAYYNTALQAQYDWHRLKAAEYYHKKPEEVTDEERELQKKRDFMELYGGSELHVFDVLTMKAAERYHKKPEDVTKAERAAEKVYSFADLYGRPDVVMTTWIPVNFKEVEEKLSAFMTVQKDKGDA